MTDFGLAPAPLGPRAAARAADCDRLPKPASSPAPRASLTPTAGADSSVPAGLSERQAQVYGVLLSMVGQPMPSRTDLAAACGLSEGQARGGLDALLDKRIVRRGLGGRFILPDGRALLPRRRRSAAVEQPPAPPQPFPRLEPPVATLPARVAVPRDVFPAPGGCLWPEGHVGEPGFHFCGAEAAPGQSYCPTHRARAYGAVLPPLVRGGS